MSRDDQLVIPGVCDRITDGCVLGGVIRKQPDFTVFVPSILRFKVIWPPVKDLLGGISLATHPHVDVAVRKVGIGSARVRDRLARSQLDMNLEAHPFIRGIRKTIARRWKVGFGISLGIETIRSGAGILHFEIRTPDRVVVPLFEWFIIYRPPRAGVI